MRKRIGIPTEATMSELLKSTKETCEFISENISGWVETLNTIDIENAKRELPHLARLLREIHKRTVIEQTKFIEANSSKKG